MFSPPLHVAQMSTEAKELLAPLFTASISKLNLESVEKFIAETELIDVAFELDTHTLLDLYHKSRTNDLQSQKASIHRKDTEDSAAEFSELSSSPSRSSKPPQSPRTPGRESASSARRLNSLLEYKGASFEPDISAGACFQTIVNSTYDDKPIKSSCTAKFPRSAQGSVPKLDFDSSDSGLLSSPVSSLEPREEAESNEEETTRHKTSKIAESLALIPRFFFPSGKPISQAENDAVLEKVRHAFAVFNGGTIHKTCDLREICAAMGVPLHWKRPLYDAIARATGYAFYGDDELPPLVFKDFCVYWKEMTRVAHDEASRFVFTLAAGSSAKLSKVRDFLVHKDFMPMIRDLIETHPGLGFLADALNFHRSYVDVVVGRIFWNVNRSWSGKITAAELKNLIYSSYDRPELQLKPKPETIRLLETTDDVNKLTDFFSYEHFYVIYCNFWDLDEDHDMLISRQDLAKYSNHGITNRIVDRIFSGAVTRGAKGTKVDKIGFYEFISFMQAEEDKRNPASIEYWFRVLDLDGDGVISLYEMEYFYEAVESKMREEGYETMAFNDVACNLLDMVSPAQPNCVTLRDLKNCALCHRFFNTLVNMSKYYEQESSEGDRDQQDAQESSDWDRFCEVEYKRQSENDDDEFEEPEQDLEE
ncbi:hypothetical protein L596_025841 [Steinernema carpocapsae]|uniref:EF-hand domain-containing protein n=1 Tax=Steinernema carpocapsae TaxID=34508 RepID=A0A4U5M8Z2_STECR|nr:hypothetical protein L596_025841 [Steinernema carpocapsae]